MLQNLMKSYRLYFVIFDNIAKHNMCQTLNLALLWRQFELVRTISLPDSSLIASRMTPYPSMFGPMVDKNINILG